MFHRRQDTIQRKSICVSVVSHVNLTTGTVNLPPPKERRY